MNDTLTGFLFQIVYLFQHLTVSDIIDILAVSTVFFVVFQALHRTRALQLLRGAIIAAILGAAFLVLATFKYFRLVSKRCIGCRVDLVTDSVSR